MSMPIAIQGELTVFTAHELKSVFLAGMSPDGSQTLDMGEVTEMDGAGLQLLVATQHEAMARGGQLLLVNVPAKVQAVLQLAGLQQHFASSPVVPEGASS